MVTISIKVPPALPDRLRAACEGAGETQAQVLERGVRDAEKAARKKARSGEER